MEKIRKEIKAYCYYCKNPIFVDQTYIVSGGEYYHISCHNLIQKGYDELDTYDYDFGERD